MKKIPLIKDARVAIIGHGRIGEEIERQLLALGCTDITTVGRETHFHSRLETIRRDVKAHSSYQKEGLPSWENIDLAFLAIPTKDDGSAARSYIMQLVKKRIPVVTCEKGALSNYFDVLQPHLDMIGYSATVGGGSGLLDALRVRASNDIQEVYFILNGTLNYVWGRLAEGSSLGEAVADAKTLGYVEPGSENSLQTLQTEALSDAIKKSMILRHLCLGKQDLILREPHFGTDLPEERLRALLREARCYRFVVSFYRNTITGEEQSLYRKQYQERKTVFYRPAGEYVIVGAFRSLEDPLIARLCAATPGVNNGFLTVEGTDGKHGTFLYAGPGGGPVPTAAAMIRDATRLLTRRTL